MGRRYYVEFENQAVTAASDLFQIKGASGKMLLVKRWGWGASDNSLPTAQNLSTRCRVLPATVTDGNGSAATVRKRDLGDAAASFTALTNSGTKATTNGTAQIVDRGARHVYNGYEGADDDGIPVGPSESFVFELLNSALQNTVKLDAFVEVEEIGG